MRLPLWVWVVAAMLGLGCAALVWLRPDLVLWAAGGFLAALAGLLTRASGRAPPDPSVATGEPQEPPRPAPGASYDDARDHASTLAPDDLAAALDDAARRQR